MSSNGYFVGIATIAITLLFIYKRMKSKLLYPIANPKITSAFGSRKHPVTGVVSFHNGIDLAAAVGTAVAAPADGLVHSIYSNTEGGNQMTIKHDNGFTTGYAHLSRYAVKAGDRVKSSQLVAYTGNTGQTTGPHLHFTLKDESGNLLDPVKYLS